MKKLILLAGAVMAFTTSCTVVTPGIATGNESIKRGEIEKKLFLGIGSVDLGVLKAAEKAGIDKVATVDFSRSGLFIVRYKVIVTGE